MITYQLSINNIPHGSIQATSRIEAVRLTNDLHKGCVGIHLSKVSEWEITQRQPQ